MSTPVPPPPSDSPAPFGAPQPAPAPGPESGGYPPAGPAGPPPGTPYPPAGTPYPPAEPQYSTPAPPSGYPAPGVPWTAPVPETPKRSLAITSLVLAVIPCTALIGLVMSIITLVKVRGSADSASRTMSIIGICVGVLWVALAIVAAVGFSSVWRVCSEYGPGVHYINGLTYSCG